MLGTSKERTFGGACKRCGDIFSKPAYWKEARGSVCGPCNNKQSRLATARYRETSHGQAVEASYRKDHALTIYTEARNRKEVSIVAVNALKSAPCADCGEKFKPHQMDFDHVKGEKKFNVAAAVHSSLPLREILEEITKCDLVCANCHRDRTFSRAQKRRLSRLQ